MRRTYGRMLGAVAAILAAGVAGFSLRPTQRVVTTVAARNPTTVKTQVIRRTIHITRHARAHVAAAPPGPHGGASHYRAGSALGVRTGASRSHAAGSAGAAGSGTRSAGSMRHQISGTSRLMS